MSDNLVVFDPKIFFEINGLSPDIAKTKRDLFTYYHARRGYLLSNLNLNPRFRRHVAKTNLLKLDFYRQNIAPVANTRSMYRDLIERLQYTTFFECLIENIHDTRAITHFYNNSCLQQLDSSNFHIVKLYADLFFEYLAFRYFGITICECLKYHFQAEYLQDQINTVSEKVAEIAQDFVTLKRELTKSLADVKQGQVLVIKCYAIDQLPLVWELYCRFRSRYVVLVEHDLFINWPVDRLVKMYRESETVSPFLELFVARLTIFYHHWPTDIVYVGELSRLTGSIMRDRTFNISARQHFVPQNCLNFEVHLIPLLRQFTTIYVNSAREGWLLGRHGLFYNTGGRIQVIGMPIVNPDLNIPVDTVDEFKHQLLDRRFIWIYLTRLPPDTGRFLRFCQTLECPVKFLTPPIEDQLTLSSKKVLSVAINIIHKYWRLCQVYFDPQPCLSRQVLHAISQRQLLILPRVNCCFETREVDYYELPVSTKSDLPGKSSRTRAKRDKDSQIPDGLSLNPYKYQINYDRLGQIVTQVTELLTGKNLENGKRLKAIRSQNSAWLDNFNSIPPPAPSRPGQGLAPVPALAGKS